MTRLPFVQALVQNMGISKLAELEGQAVRHRPVPLRLVRRLEYEKTSLTPRQRECMVLLASGYTRREMAEELGVSLETIKGHLRLAYHRLGAHNQISAVNAFLEEAA